VPPEDDPPSEELELELGLGKLESVPEETDGSPPEPGPTMYGQGLQAPYENPHVCPRRHVQAKPLTGSLGQLWIAVHVWPDEPEPEPVSGPGGVFREGLLVFRFFKRGGMDGGKLNHVQLFSCHTR
jgi:hypothetical protein